MRPDERMNQLQRRVIDMAMQQLIEQVLRKELREQVEYTYDGGDYLTVDGCIEIPALAAEIGKAIMERPGG
ncbi:hypothetical protein [Mycobacteroides abscessus]|uniref:hypothetical protein n=1 Tax=Mycobacteroides abscessus TaxID=36809 RepID=UPI00092A8E6E|nr:hypothetical protein [Mycobacteroides abscessus]SID02355.1 Uncharacterised protein [Mycobacteroides abscessus subsp. abscessus]SKU54263.1 Uncharacterised protein [Mycobacteroides abscessus subsp. bolletii]